MNAWRPAETAPRDGSECLVTWKFAPLKRVISIGHFVENDWYDDNDKLLGDITHWMPLPELPERNPEEVTSDGLDPLGLVKRVRGTQ